MKKLGDLTPYTNTLPYASEIFGVYQPIIGWRSKRIQRRIARGFAADKAVAFDALYKKFRGGFELALTDRAGFDRISHLEPAQLGTSRKRTTSSFVLDAIAATLPPLEALDDAALARALEPAHVKALLSTVVVPKVTQWYRTAHEEPTQEATHPLVDQVAEQVQREAAVAGLLVHLHAEKQFAALKDLFYKADTRVAQLKALLAAQNPLDHIDPFHDLDRVGLSPLGVVHLFRQYFFELDTFLGSPVEHVWLSPGATVELVETSTRKTTIERTIESTIESTVKTEKSTTEQDEIADAVKHDNKDDTKFGVNATANQSWIGGSATASSSLDLASTQSRAREVTHKRMREQTEKLSTEIRKNYKSTFKTVTETTDLSSKRYILKNDTGELINYEMRRKMRQVAVQVQDIGTYLCWQTYVDDPGRQLGIAKLVHLAQGPELATIPPPESVPMPPDVVTEHNVEIPFVPLTEDTDPEDDMDEAYEAGVEKNLDFNEGDPEKIQSVFKGISAACDQPGYEYAEVIEFDYGGSDVVARAASVVESTPGRITFDVRLDHVNFRNVSPLRVVAKVSWRPTQDVVAKVNDQNAKNVAKFTQQTRLEYEKAFVEAARDRIKKASNIEPRSFDDLREEERIIVYRNLVQGMLTADLPMPDDRTRHAVAELLNTIFDVDKMLYFVAPEWWRPRMHHSHQALGAVRKPPSTTTTPARSVAGQVRLEAAKRHLTEVAVAHEDQQIAKSDTVTWGGAYENRVDNYYITEESTPAKLGSSLGWLLQLDGDNLRNAFLNAPWVKAVLPIRPGQERAAMNWLQRLHVEGTEGLDAAYIAPPAELAKIPHAGPTVTVRDAIEHLCTVVAKKHADSLTVGRYPEDEISDDNRVSAIPIDKVYEHGFYPLKGGFRARAVDDETFEVFDQWIEVLPTDQVVPVPVAYDPKSGRQL